MAPVIRSTKGKAKKPNAIRRIMEREESRERRVRERSATLPAEASSSGLTTQASRLQCPNPTCRSFKVSDGTCSECGAVAEENNIVSEITFGEAANGAAVVQGNYLAADQGFIRPQGGHNAFRRVPGSGSEARARSEREVKQLLQQWSLQLKIRSTLVDKALSTYKVASGSDINFVQGRRRNNVAAICLYAVCRQEPNNEVMLIDLADILKTDVFLLGRDYKALLSKFPDMREGTKPIILEDLIHRFAAKLEFYHDTPKVALTAVRIAARMRKDNITHGRRPAGICGAAIILAARAHNYRRTHREVVYIAKVTMATLQERMEEFANVPSAQLTIKDFHSRDLKETFDPPRFYKQSKEWQEKHPSRKRKAREISWDDAPAVGASPNADPSSNGSALTASSANDPAPVLDKDGFVVPPLPRRALPEDLAVNTDKTANAEPDEQLESLEALASEYGDSDSEEADIDPNSEMAMAAAQGIIPMPAKKNPPKDGEIAGSSKKGKRILPVDEEWEEDEDDIERDIDEYVENPVVMDAFDAARAAVDKERAQDSTNETPSYSDAPTGESNGKPTEQNGTETGATLLPETTPGSRSLDDPIIHEDEFKDDPEVIHCLLSENDAKEKERIWANHNKDYLRMVQQKIFESKMSANGPPKQRRNRAKKPRIGEGQATPAESAEEATLNMLHTRSITTRLDYTKIMNVFDMSKSSPSSVDGTNSLAAGSVSASVAASEAGSEMGNDGKEGAVSNVAAVASAAAANAEASSSTSQSAAKEANNPAPDADEDEEMGEDDNYDEDGGYNDYDEDNYGDETMDPFGGSDAGGYSDEE